PPLKKPEVYSSSNFCLSDFCLEITLTSCRVSTLFEASWLRRNVARLLLFDRALVSVKAGWYKLATWSLFKKGPLIKLFVKEKAACVVRLLSLSLLSW